MSVLESTHLRDLLRVRDNNNEDDGRDSLAGLTLAAVLGCETSSSTIEHRPRILRIPTFANGRSTNSSENSPWNEGGGIESVSRSTGNSISLAESLAREREEQRPAREEVGSNLIENR
ncbi:hypothetical protein IFM89_028124 [Coptis chinensis]|uniref:Uncharacterized protein n=1 Tax=Coptis chinensis TaxID=261450 RepID=A0A835I0F1_9MAGN|nr:hypothetical protein IFM89_028124 [Coptis chinensis]